jgi:hypothetical protein
MAMSAASGERQYPSDDDIYVCGGDSGMMRDSHGHLQRGVLAMMRRRVAIGCALLIVVAAAGFLVVRSHTSPGPLQALSAGGQAIVDGASVEVTPGESADFTAFVWNRLTSPVTLVSATIVPVTGYAPTGKLAHVAISTTNGLVGASVGWPIIHPVFLPGHRGRSATASTTSSSGSPGMLLVITTRPGSRSVTAIRAGCITSPPGRR